MGILAILIDLFGCSKKPKPAQHALSDLSTVSIACCHMDRSYGYSFWIHREQDNWLFDADCFTQEHQEETILKGREVSDEDADVLFEILERNDSIVYAENYRKPKKLPYVILDETTYSFTLTFSDGSSYLTRDYQKELEEFFYRLAENTNLCEGDD